MEAQGALSCAPRSPHMCSRTKMGLLDHDMHSTRGHAMGHRPPVHHAPYVHTQCRATTPHPRHEHSGGLVGSSFQADTGRSEAMSTTTQHLLTG